MRTFDLAAVQGVAIDAYGSTRLRMTSLLRQGTVVVAQLEAGGSIGAHEAPTAQLLVVVAGRAAVRGAGAEVEEIGAGQGVLWQRGETHGTQALEDLTALVVEGDELARTLA